MCSSRECARYLKSQPTYRRCLEELRKKWKTLGKAAGRITLKEASEEERRAVGGIIGRVFYEDTIRFSFQEFEAGLQKTRFAPVDMRELLEEYFGEPLTTVRGQKQEAQERKERFLDRLCGSFEENFGRESAAFQWAEKMIAEKKFGYQLLMREYTKEISGAERLAGQAAAALMRLKERSDRQEEYPLAVLAAEATGNPHALDRGTAAGQLFVHALCFCEEAKPPRSAHQWRNLLMQVSIAPDNLSSLVHAYGLRLQTGEGWHPAYEAFCERREPCVITMENLRGITGARAVGGRAYVVENEMVFSFLVQNLGTFSCTLLCTSGQPRSAAQVLIPLLLEGQGEVYYSGDLDPDGICIADRLWKQFGASFHIWRMSSADYESCLSEEKIGDTGRAKLEAVSHPLLGETAARVKETGLAGYQENLLKELLADILEQNGEEREQRCTRKIQF